MQIFESTFDISGGVTRHQHLVKILTDPLYCFVPLQWPEEKPVFLDES